MLLYAVGNNCNLKYKMSVISTGGNKVTDTADTILDLWKEMLKSNFSLKVVKYYIGNDGKPDYKNNQKLTNNSKEIRK